MITLLMRHGPMVDFGLTLTPPVRNLAELARRALLGQSTAGLVVTAELAHFAIHRHKCGPLLHRAAQLGAQVDGAANASLDRHWSDNKREHLRNRLATERAAGALSLAGIPALSFKGAPLAQALYANPLWRHCGDVDIIVPGQSLFEALKVLTEAGFRSDDALLRLPPAGQRFVFSLLRDVAIDDRWSESHMEVHSRVLFSRRLSRLHEALGQTMRPQPVLPDGSLAAPALDANLALYLFSHGCISGWSRLKWLVDMMPVLDRIGAAGRRTLADQAERAGTAAAVKASLLLLLAAFGNMDIAPLDAWVAEQAGMAGVRSRASRYANWLGSDGSRMPLHQRAEVFKTTVMLHDRLVDQIETAIAAGFTSAVRQVATAVGRSRAL